jgi:hypothetical protein
MAWVFFDIHPTLRKQPIYGRSSRDWDKPKNPFGPTPLREKGVLKC